MSTVEIEPGSQVEFDPNDERVITFDFDRLNLPASVVLASYVITITPIRQNGQTALTFDNGTLAGANRKVQARFLATTATLGDLYWVSCKGQTNETPAQKKDYSIKVLVQRK